MCDSLSSCLRDEKEKLPQLLRRLVKIKIDFGHERHTLRAKLCERIAIAISFIELSQWFDRLIFINKKFHCKIHINHHKDGRISRFVCCIKVDPTFPLWKSVFPNVWAVLLLCIQFWEKIIQMKKKTDIATLVKMWGNFSSLPSWSPLRFSSHHVQFSSWMSCRASRILVIGIRSPFELGCSRDSIGI